MRKQTILSFLLVILFGIAVGTFYFRNFYFEEPEKAVTEAFDSVIAQDDEKAVKYLDYWMLYGGHHEREVYQAIMRDFQYEIKEVQQNDASAVATVTVSNRDMEEIYGQFVVDAYQLVISDAYQPEQERMGQDKMKQEIDALLLKYLTDGQTKTRSADIKIDMSRVGRSWYLTIDDEDLDAIYGGYVTAQKAADNVLGDLSTEALANLEKAYQRNIDDTKHVLRNAVHYIVDDIWNQILCNIVSCINAGTDVNGEAYDIDAGMAELDERLKEKEQYDTYIEALDDVNYSEIKEVWQSLTDACNALVTELKEENPEPVDFDYIPDTTAFEDAMQRFVKMVYPESEE